MMQLCAATYWWIRYTVNECGGCYCNKMMCFHATDILVNLWYCVLWSLQDSEMAGHKKQVIYIKFFLILRKQLLRHKKKPFVMHQKKNSNLWTVFTFNKWPHFFSGFWTFRSCITKLDSSKECVQSSMSTHSK
jgi:hypothetical protein